MLTPVDCLVGEDEEETRRINAMVSAARDLIASYAWCPPVKSMHLAYGVLEIIGLFLIDLEADAPDVGNRMWIVVGDVPSWHGSVMPFDSPRNALERYCGIMGDWCSEMKSLKFDGHFASDLPELGDYVDLLEDKLDYIRANFIPAASVEAIPDGVIDLKSLQ